MNNKAKKLRTVSLIHPNSHVRNAAKMAAEMIEDCELEYCQNPNGKAEIRVNENWAGSYWNVGICEDCAGALGLQAGDDLPSAEVVKEKLTSKK